jgi:hypothetical protein
VRLHGVEDDGKSCCGKIDGIEPTRWLNALPPNWWFRAVQAGYQSLGVQGMGLGHGR